LQLFTPKHIEPVRFSVLATPFTRDMAALPALADELSPWKASLDAAVRNGELYSQPVPITDPDDCNAIGQQYGGPVMLVGDTNTYSAGDLFSAGFVDNAIGPFLCVGEATGAGGANVWDYDELRKALAGTAIALPPLTGGIGLSFSFRRATRAGPSEGLTIEDVGVAGAPYAMTRNDLLAGNGDLLLRCVALLRQQPLSALAVALDKPGRKGELHRARPRPRRRLRRRPSGRAAFRSPRATASTCPSPPRASASRRRASRATCSCSGVASRSSPSSERRVPDGVTRPSRGGAGKYIDAGATEIARRCVQARQGPEPGRPNGSGALRPCRVDPH
jgi:hypothetical protein